ncbi:MAG TPA: biotin--[acetyl-CoA-carboxylase] ligase [Planctomycetota bacterium]|nr:biotin--[acetyl-CoA-carboxylase] ligase [Planctomycetota bacterium]HRU51061.1 biotin--[acetyl-CoA-carboxylase] ligase [Planctomycetota bacterium]
MQNILLPNHSFIHIKEVDSTNSECRRLWDKNQTPWVVVADSQTQGRGRHGRTWESSSNQNLYLSMIHKNPFQKQIGLLNLYFGVVIYETIEELFGNFQNNLTLKWPNDLYIGDKKIAGILLESLDISFKYIIFGVGINLVDENIPETATSLFVKTTPIEHGRENIVQRLVYKLDNAQALHNISILLNKFQKYSARTREYEYLYHAPHYKYKAKLHEIFPDGTIDICQDGKIISLKN